MGIYEYDPLSKYESTSNSVYLDPDRYLPFEDERVSYIDKGDSMESITDGDRNFESNLNFIVKDSGERDEFDTGAKRDTEKGKSRIDLIDEIYLGQLIERLETLNGDIEAYDIIDKALTYRTQAYHFSDSGNVPFHMLYLSLDLIAYAIANYDLTFEEIIYNLGLHLSKGAEKYDPNNWRKGMSSKRVWSSFIRHLFQYLGELDIEEDHLSACLFNLMAINVYYQRDTFKGNSKVRNLNERN